MVVIDLLDQLFFKLLNDEEFITYLKIQKELLEMNEETNRIILQNLLKIFLDFLVAIDGLLYA